MSRNRPSPQNEYLAETAALLCESFARIVGRPLVAEGPALGRRLFEAPFALVAHDTRPDPVFMYANQTALDLFALDWDAFTKLPSHRSAEPVNREERARLLAEVTRNGFIADYAGVRIASTGRRFRIEQATVWNLVDAAGVYRGQAATFSRWTDL